MQINKPTRIFVHTTDASYKKIPKQFFAVNDWHKERFGGYCKSSLGYYGGYHILIEPDGWEGRYREDSEEACAAVGHNTDALHVAIAFDGDEELPTSSQNNKLRERLQKWTTKYNIPVDQIHIAPHRAVAPHKTCYGSLLSDVWVYRLVEPVEKEPAQQEKKESIENKNYLALQLQVLLLQLKILLAKAGMQSLNPRPLK